VIRLCPAVGIVLLLLALTACSRPPAEEQIRNTLDEMSEAIAQGDVSAFLDPVAEDFAGDTWQLDKRGARLLLMREMRAHEQLRARLIDIQIELASADRATATFQAVLTGGTGLLPDDGGWYRVETGWRLDGADWTLINAQWERVIGR
jgi:hypothetical protein